MFPFDSSDHMLCAKCWVLGDPGGKMANDAALVLVDALLSLDVLLLLVDEGVTFGLRVFSHASLHADLMVFKLRNFMSLMLWELKALLDLSWSLVSSDFFVLERDQTFLLSWLLFPDLLFPDLDEPVVVDNVISSVILNSGLDSFCVSCSIRFFFIV